MSADRRFVIVRVVGVFAVVLLLSAADILAQEGRSSRIDALVQEAIRQVSQAEAQRPPGSPPPEEPARPLMLDDAVKLALEKNLDIMVQRQNPQMVDLSIASLKSVYRPTLVSTVGNENKLEPPITLLTGGFRVETTTTTFNAGVTENLSKGGGTLSFVWDNNRVSSDNVFYNFNPAFNTNIKAEYTQPLLRGYKTDSARQQIVVTKLNREVSDLDLQTTIVNTLTNVRTAYWDFVFAVQSVDVARRSVDLASQLVRENQSRVEFGTMTRLDLATARAQEAQSQHALVQAEGNRRVAEVALKRLLVGGGSDSLWQTTLDPVDRPALDLTPIEVEAAVRRALNERTDLQQAKRQLAANEASYQLLRDQTKPQADLVASYTMVGLGGNQIIRPPGFFTDPVNNPIIAVIPGGYGDALGSMFRQSYPTWNIAVNFSYPFGFNPAKAAAAKAEIQLQQVDAQLHQVEVRIVSEVTNAAIQVRNNADDVTSSRVALTAAQEKLTAEQRKFQAGISTNFQVVQAQRDLADAENAELRAEVNYRKALVDFDQAQHATLQSAGVTVVPTGGLVSPSVGSRRP
jgi:outer membrane protein TolC